MKRVQYLGAAICSFMLATSFVLSSGSPAEAQTVWQMASPYPDANPHTRNIRAFIEEIERDTSGALKISLHSNASLVKHPEIPRATRIGTVQMGEVLLSSMGNDDPIFAFDSIPGLAPSYGEASRLWAIAKPKVAAALEKRGLLALYTVPWQPTGIFSNKPLNAIADLKNSKFRTFSPPSARFAELIHAIPTTVQVPEIAQAFRTGLVDAMLTSGATAIDTQAWDYVKYYTNTQSLLVLNVVFANKKEFDRQPEAVRRAILAAAERAEARGWKNAEELTASLNQTMTKNGIQIIEPSDALKSGIQAVGSQMAGEWAKKAGADGTAILEAYKKR